VEKSAGSYLLGQLANVTKAQCQSSLKLSFEFGSSNERFAVDFGIIIQSDKHYAFHRLVERTSVVQVTITDVGMDRAVVSRWGRRIRVLLVAPDDETWKARTELMTSQGVDVERAACAGELKPRFQYELVILSTFPRDECRDLRDTGFASLASHIRSEFGYAGYLLGVIPDPDCRHEARAAAKFTAVLTVPEFDGWLPTAFREWPSSLIFLTLHEF
jgi:hypothetical protein